ncbi:hypothetical protein Dtox_1754 [Desulfofarcimen acetoxidans DSM 771]|uniref:Uncharacterized protein n=1 Tax=Desulfofarcimen acetoxidans (strain ATCC 49208 / DSM 771 / KCTC 5769 / VKM B-1644 / 5575) TaxID=485916 RepID=C8VX35_DESAS|nr:hypothetical protein [Desulfofarcimen acetoxidans]ACV62611.1 hypothetical protein Dtox_1754 [Desulfofarcimen acetoxidans DSM 771]
MVLLGHNVKEKNSTTIYTPKSLYSQDVSEVQKSPSRPVGKYNARSKSGFSSRLLTVSSKILYSQNKNAVDQIKDIPQNILEKEIRELEKARPITLSNNKGGKFSNSEDVGIKLTALTQSAVNNSAGQPDVKRQIGSGKKAITPTKQIIIYNANRPQGELTDNSIFNDWLNNTPHNWKTENVLKTREALTGTYAIRLGGSPEKKAYIYQDIVVLPGCFYEIKCNFKIPAAHARSPAIKLLWLNSNAEIIGYGMKLYITPGEKTYYQNVSCITGKSPPKVVYSRLYFEKHDHGIWDIDMVSFRCL